MFRFINFYAPNRVSEREGLFTILKEKLSDIDQGECRVLGGDWNFCTDFTLDRTGEEPHFQLSSVLSHVLKKTDLVDVWRMKPPSVRQYMWVKITDGRVSATTLDRFYVSSSFTAQGGNCRILSVVFTEQNNNLLEPFQSAFRVIPPKLWLDHLESQFGISSQTKIVPVRKNTMCFLQ